MPNKLVFNNVANELLTQIYGTDGHCLRAVKTDTSGRLEVVGTFTAVTADNILELKAKIEDGTGEGPAMVVETMRMKMYSFFVANTGTGTFRVKLQVAPEFIDELFLDDESGVFTLGPGAVPKAILVPRFYMKYTRMWYEAIDGTVNANVWFYGHG